MPCWDLETLVVHLENLLFISGLYISTMEKLTVVVGMQIALSGKK
jgi:hypothetical protein